jgi:hypothetical protein
MKTEFTDDELNDIFALSKKIEDVVNDNDFTIVFNALLLNLAGGGRLAANTIAKEVYTQIAFSNLDAWWNYQDELDAEQREHELKNAFFKKSEEMKNAFFLKAQEKALQEQFKRTDWHYQRAEGNGYYEGRESYEKTMRMVNAMGDEGHKLMEVYLAESGIKP